MKRYFIMITTIAIFMVACQRENVPINGNGSSSVTINVDGFVSTKATGGFDAGDTLIHNLQVYCFNDNLSGRLEKYCYVTSNSCTMDVISGSKHIYALANYGDSLIVETENEFLESVTNFADNRIGSFHMLSPVGDGARYTITKDTEINLSVKRYVSKVLVRKITAGFGLQSLSDLEFIVNGIYLDRVAKNNTLDCSVVPDSFFFGDEDNGAAVNGMIRDTCSYDLTGNKSLDILHGFYAYPNSSSDATRLVIKATLMGIGQTYSFDLPPVERNKIYDVSEITITRPSGELSDLTFDIKIADWISDTIQFNY